MALSISLSVPDVASGTVEGEANRVHPYLSSEDTSIVRKINGVPNLSAPSLATPKLKGRGLLSLLQIATKPFPPLSLDLCLHPSLLTGIR